MSGMTKAERLAEMKRLYIQRTFTDAEMAEKLNVDRTTIYRDRMELTLEYPIEQDYEGRYHIERSKLISEINMGSSVYTTPVVANNVLYIANKDHLFAIEAEKK